MALEFALRFAAFTNHWSASGTAVPGLRLGAADVFLMASPQRVTLPGRRSFKVVTHVADSDSAAQVPPRTTTKGKLDDSSQTKAEKQLLNDLRAFIVSCDLPRHEVPSTPELARHGSLMADSIPTDHENAELDLANRVRRRGYKRMAQLLQQVRIAGTGAKSQYEMLTRPGYGSDSYNVHQTEQSSSTDEAISDDMREKDDVGRLSSGGDLGGTSQRGSANGHIMYEEEAVRDAKRDHLVLQPDAGDDRALEVDTAVSSISPDNFTGSTDADIDTKDVGDLGKDSTQWQGLRDEDKGIEDSRPENEIGYLEVSDPGVDEIQDRSEGDINVPGPSHLDSPSQEIASQKAALSKAKLLQYFDSRSLDLKQKELVTNLEAEENGAVIDTQTQILQCDGGLQVFQEIDYRTEFERLKSLLRSRESELAEVTRHLEEAQVILSLARAKATAGLMHVRQLAAEQDVRSNAVEQATSQLKTVHLEWWGEAGRVEVSGSFNGWDHHIFLKPDPSSEIPKADGSRGPMMWGTYLCLYPGVHEIKFIVDGKWQVDYRREVVFRDIFQNNLLRVD